MQLKCIPIIPTITYILNEKVRYLLYLFLAAPISVSSKLNLRLFFAGLFPQIQMMDPGLTVLKVYESNRCS